MNGGLVDPTRHICGAGMVSFGNDDIWVSTTHPPLTLITQFGPTHPSSGQSDHMYLMLVKLGWVSGSLNVPVAHVECVTEKVGVCSQLVPHSKVRVGGCTRVTHESGRSLSYPLPLLVRHDFPPKNLFLM
jgi:hypothetical protein